MAVKFYRVHYTQEGGNSSGFSWHTDRREAQRAAAEAARANPDEYARDMPDIIAVEIKPTKSGILEALKAYADHPDNG